MIDAKAEPTKPEPAKPAATSDGKEQKKSDGKDQKDQKEDAKEGKAGSMASRASAAKQRQAKEPAQEKPAAKDRAAAASGKDTAKPPPPRRGSGGLLGGLVLGVLLAVAVAVGAVYSRDSWLPLVDPGSGQPSQALAEVLGAVKGLEDGVAALRSDLPPDNSAAIGDLNQRLTSLEAALSQGAGQDPKTVAALESLSANLAMLGDRLQAVEQSQAAVGDPNQATEALAGQFTARLGSEAARVDELQTAQSELAARLEAAERDLASAAANREAAPGSEETLMLLAMLQLRDAIRGSGPYDQPLRMLQNLAGDDPALAEALGPLERRAPAGLPSLLDLQGAFPEVARRIAAIELGEEGEGWSAGVLRRISEAVNLRPVGMVEGEQATAVAARAEVKLNDGDLAGAVAELDGLNGAAAEAAAAWRSDAEARLAADRAVSTLGAQVSERFRMTAGG